MLDGRPDFHSKIENAAINEHPDAIQKSVAFISVTGMGKGRILGEPYAPNPLEIDYL